MQFWPRNSGHRKETDIRMVRGMPWFLPPADLGKVDAFGLESKRNNRGLAESPN